MLCHRPAAPAIAQVVEPQSRSVSWLSGIGLVASLAGVAWIFVERQSAVPERTVMAVVSSVDPTQQKRMAAEPGPKAEAPAPSQPTESSERIEDTPSERERPALRVPGAFPPAELARREREREEQDRKRHEAVQRDLQRMSLLGARRDVNITMYSTSWCGVCARARRYMSAKNIPFTDLDVEHDASAHARAAMLNPRGSVPTIVIADEVQIGFSAGSLEAGIDRAARKRSGS